MFTKITHEHVRKYGKREIKSWMTDGILQLIDQRRLFKNKHLVKYREIQKVIRQKIRMVTKPAENCKEIEKLNINSYCLNMFKRTKQTVGGYKKTWNNYMINKRGNILSSTHEKLIYWKQYIQDLFSNNKNVFPLISTLMMV